jgi:hypothetical protein
MHSAAWASYSSAVCTAVPPLNQGKYSARDFVPNATEAVMSWMMSHPYIDDPKYWRERAEEARSIAKLLNDQEAKRQLLAIASRYERLADHIKQRPKS